MHQQSYWVYIMGGASKSIYVGFTSDLLPRVWEHKTKVGSAFTTKYNLDKLLFYNEFRTPMEGIEYEKKLKRFLRSRKDTLIREMNPELVDLAADWYDSTSAGSIPGDSSVA